jgi:hypothetical protein
MVRRSNGAPFGISREETLEKRPVLESTGLFLCGDYLTLVLVERYSESDLSNVRVDIRVPHREAIPERRDAGIC